jgi:hypothetical protein
MYDDFMWTGSTATNADLWWTQLQAFWTNALSNVDARGVWYTSTVLADIRYETCVIWLFARRAHTVMLLLVFATQCWPALPIKRQLHVLHHHAMDDQSVALVCGNGQRVGAL